jgi:hypothetical protein
VFAVHRHLANVFRQKRLQTLEARAKFVSSKFKSDDDHPFIWHQYVVGDIPNHPETGGYQTVGFRLLRFPSFSNILCRLAVVSSKVSHVEHASGARYSKRSPNIYW